MSKTIVVSDKVYAKLKSEKERKSKNYNELIDSLIPEEKPKTLSGLKKFFGILKGDREYRVLMKESRKGWGTWTKKYA